MKLTPGQEEKFYARIAALPGDVRVRLMDQAVHDVRLLGPRPCGRQKCPPNCLECYELSMEALFWLVGRYLKGNEPVGQPVCSPTEQVATFSAPSEPVPPERVAELIRSKRLGNLLPEEG